MKKIHIIRHAKSSWGDVTLSDIDRPLNERGKRDAPIMARVVSEAGCSFEHVFCSPAVRAQSTIELISEALPKSEIEWRVDGALYTFDSPDLLEWFRLLDNALDEITMVGHNPAVTDTCNHLSGDMIANVPTCGYVQLVARQECRWEDIHAGAFELATFLRPKDFRS